MDTAFRHQHAIFRYARRELVRRLEAGLESLEVSVVDPDEGRGHGECRIQFDAVVDFHQHIEPNLHRTPAQQGQFLPVQDRGNQQDAVRAQRSRFINLVGVDGEILAQHRQGTGIAGGDQIIIGALKKIHIGQHR